MPFAGVPGANPDKYGPVLLKFEPTRSNFRLVGATLAKPDELEASAAGPGNVLVVCRRAVTVNSKKTASGAYHWQALAAGEYGIALRPINKNKEFSGGSVSENVGDRLIFNSAWSFEVRRKGVENQSRSNRWPIPAEAG